MMIDMKKWIALTVLLSLFCLSVCSCGKDDSENESTDEISSSEITTEEETQKAASISEMSPEKIDTDLPDFLKVKVSDIDFDSFDEIKAKNSFFPDSAHDKILESDNAQYFFIDGDVKVHAVFYENVTVTETENTSDSENTGTSDTTEKTEKTEKKVVGSASYDTKTGFAEFYGDSDKTWYFDDSGEVSCVVFTYSFGSGTPAIYTFYSPDGEKDVIRTVDGWYSADLDLLSNEEVFDCVQKYSETIEAVAEYNSSATPNTPTVNTDNSNSSIEIVN